MNASARAQPPSMADFPWADRSLSADERASLVVSALTEDEKLSWVCGGFGVPFQDKPMPEGALGSAGFFPAIPRLALPALQMADASLGVSNPGGIREDDQATALPSAIALAATFDPQLAHESGAMVGRQARAKGFNVQLAGGANLVREPRCGRNFEYLSEDPLLTGIMAGRSIAGIQSQGVVSTIKHYLLNAQETGRVMADSRLDEAAARESDLLAFQIGIEHGRPGSVMTSYNLVNGDYGSENGRLINDILKGDWGYAGWVMSDWGATHSTVKAALAGLDQQCGSDLDPERFFAEPLARAIEAGEVPQSRLDDMLQRILRSLFAVGALDDPPEPGAPIDFEADDAVAQRVAENGIVLLKNEGDLLPLPLDPGRILVIGSNADRGVPSGGGSSSVTPRGSIHEPGAALDGMSFTKTYHPAPPLDAVKAATADAMVDHLDGSDLDAAARSARDASVVLVFVEQWTTEGRDVADLALPGGQDELIAAVANANPRTIVVLQTGGPVRMPWLDQVPAVLAAWYSGSRGGTAIASVLFGRVAPSGRLPVSFPRDESQLPRPHLPDPEATTSLPGVPTKGPIFPVDYDIEGSEVGYRWFLRQRLQPLFPFGFGLSYTTFAYSDLTARADEGTITASARVRNSGSREGTDTPQLYVERPGDDGFVPRLAGFSRLALRPGEVREVDVRIDPRILSRFDSGSGEWVRSKGTYLVSIGASALDRPLSVAVDL